MKREELYKIALRVIKNQNSYEKKSCYNCIAHSIKAELNKVDFYDYKGYHKDSCSSPLFYLEDLGIIKILSGGNRIEGVDCHDLEIKICNFKYNKI